jgi:hypothetical protein
LVEGKGWSAIGLTPRHVRVLAWLFFDGLTQDEVARRIRKTRQRVSQLKLEALTIIKDAGLPSPFVPKTGRMQYFDGRELERIF